MDYGHHNSDSVYIDMRANIQSDTDSGRPESNGSGGLATIFLRKTPKHRAH